MLSGFTCLSYSTKQLGVLNEFSNCPQLRKEGLKKLFLMQYFMAMCSIHLYDALTKNYPKSFLLILCLELEEVGMLLNNSLIVKNEE